MVRTAEVRLQNRVRQTKQLYGTRGREMLRQQCEINGKVITNKMRECKTELRK